MSAAFADRDDLARRLNRLRRRGVVVGWGTLLVGLHGFGWVDRQVSSANAIAIALDALARDPEDVLVLALACLLENETEDVVRALERLAEREGADHGLERRKWRLLLLDECLEPLAPDPLYGLLALSAFWDTFGHPEDGPYSVPRAGKVLPADDTRDSYETEVARHQRWMDREASLLKQADAVASGVALPDVP